MSTIAEHAAAYLREANAAGVYSGFWSLDCGHLQALHDIYDRSLEGGENRLAPLALGIRNPRAARERYAVRFGAVPFRLVTKLAGAKRFGGPGAGRFSVLQRINQ